MLKVAIGMMNQHVVPKQPAFKGSLLMYAGWWDVYQMLMTYRGTKFTKEDCGIAFLKDIVCPRVAPLAKVELGLLGN